MPVGYECNARHILGSEVVLYGPAKIKVKGNMLSAKKKEQIQVASAKSRSKVEKHRQRRVQSRSGGYRGDDIYTNPVLDAMLDPDLHVGYADRETSSAIRTQVIEANIDPTVANTSLSVVVRADASRTVGIFQTGVGDNTLHTYSSKGSYVPGTDPLYSTSACRVGGNVDVALTPFMCRYGEGGTTTTNLNFLRFLGKAGELDSGLCPLQDNNGGVLPSDGYGFFELPASLVAAGAALSIRLQQNWDSPAATGATPEQCAVFQYTAADPALAGASIGSQSVAGLQQEAFSFGATLVPGNGNYIRVRYQSDGTAAGGTIRNLVSSSFQMNWTGDDAVNYEYQPLPDAGTLAAMSSGWRFNSQHLWLQYRANVLVEGGNVVGTQMPTSEFLAHGRPWTATDIYQRNAGFFEGAVPTGAYSMWSPKGEDDLKFKEWDYNPTDSTVIVIAIENLPVGASFRLMARQSVEIETRAYVAGPQTRKVEREFLDEAIEVMGGRKQWVTENPFHERVISSLKSAGRWVYDNRDKIVKFVKGTYDVAATVGKMAIMAAPFLV